MQTVNISPQAVAAQVRKQFRNHFGSAASPLLNLARSISHPIRFGLYSESAHAPLHQNSRAAMASRRWATQLRVTWLCGHFLADSQMEFVWFVNACPLTLAGAEHRRFLLAQWDIDDHQNGGDSHEMLAHLQGSIPFLSAAYVEPSTNGRGLHVYLPILFPRRMTNGEIKDCLDALQARTTEISNAGQHQFGIISSCHEVRGRPSIPDPANVWNPKYSGELVKLPRPHTRESAQILLDICSNPILWEQWAAWLLPPTEGQELETKGNCDITDCGEMTSLKIPQPVGGGAFQRTLDAAKEFVTAHRRPPSGCELLEFYESRGYATGNRTPRRQKRCEQVAQIASTKFDQSKCRSDPLVHLGIVKDRITQAEIAKIWTSKTSCLKHEDIALILFLIAQKGACGTPRDFAKGYFLKASRVLKAEGRVARTLDNKRIAAGKRLLVAKGFIEITRIGRKGMGATQIRLVPETLTRAMPPTVMAV